jgi:4-coumarate--CoA ligase
MAKNPIVLHYDLSSVRMVMLGAAPLGKDLENELQDLQLPDAVVGQVNPMSTAFVNRLSQCMSFV